MDKRRKVGARNYKNYTEEMLQIAVELVKKKKLSSYAAEKQFGIPRRTILNKVNEKHSNKVGRPIRLSDSEEKAIISVLIAASEFGCPFSMLDLRLAIYYYLERSGKSYIFKGKPPGRRWVKFFVTRHRKNLTVRIAQNIKRCRAEKSASEMTDYFENLKKSVENVLPHNILNFDETNLSDNPGNSKCIFRRGVKYPERILNYSKGSISIMFAATAAGVCLPPYVVYKAKNIYEEWCTGGPKKTRYGFTQSGWFDHIIFEDWFKTIVLPWARGQDGVKVIIGDNLSSHINVSIVELCEQFNIRFVFLPPNATHLVQPLDVSFFAPMKKIWRNILFEYKVKNPSAASLNKCDFPKLLNELMQKIDMTHSGNIKNGFMATGIYPFNPKRVLDKLPDYKDDFHYNVNESLLEFLKENRFPDTDKKRTRRKKVNVEPGKSISTDDFVVPSSSLMQQDVQIQPLDSPSVSDTQKKQVVGIILDTPVEIKRKTILCEKTGTFINVSEVNKKVEIPQQQEKRPLADTKIRLNIEQPKTINAVERKRNSETSTDSDYSLRDSSCDDLCDFEEIDSSDSSTGDKTFEYYSNETNSFQVSNLNTDVSPSEVFDGSNIHQGTYVLVRFNCTGLENQFKYYVGTILEVNENSNYVTKFLRHKGRARFSFPQADDISTVLISDIVKVLPDPKVLRRGVLQFAVNFNNYRIF